MSSYLEPKQKTVQFSTSHVCLPLVFGAVLHYLLSANHIQNEMIPCEDVLWHHLTSSVYEHPWDRMLQERMRYERVRLLLYRRDERISMLSILPLTRQKWHEAHSQKEDGIGQLTFFRRPKKAPRTVNFYSQEAI